MSSTHHAVRNRSLTAAQPFDKPVATPTLVTR